MRASSSSARAGTIASSSGASPSIGVSLTDEPVRVGRGHHELARPRSGRGCRSAPGATRRATRSARPARPSRAAPRGRRVNVPTASTSGRRGKSSALYVCSGSSPSPQSTRTTPSSARCSIVHLGVRQQPHEVEQQRPGTTTAPSPSTCASSDVRSESSMSVAASCELAVLGAQQDRRARICTVVRVETPRGRRPRASATSSSRETRELHPRCRPLLLSFNHL